MACRVLPLGGGLVMVCGRKVARSCLHCARDGTRRCDWKLAPAVTCSAPLCEDHAHVPAPGKDLCPRHRDAWLEKQRQQELAL